MSELLFEDDLKKLLEECENMVTTENYVVDEYTKERDREIELAKKNGVDLEPYANDEYTGFQLHEIRIGLEEKLEVKLYDNTEFSWEQMRQIRKGLESGVDVSEYADPLYSDLQMREIRRGLEEGVDTYSYAKLLYSTTDMHKKRSELFSAKYYADPHGFAKTYTDCETGITIRLTDDLMEAYVKLPKGGSITENELYALLEDYDITFGYIDENIKLLAAKGSAAGEVLAAKGEQLQKGCDGSYKMLWRKFEPPTPYVRKDGTMDFATVDTSRIEAGTEITVKGSKGVICGGELTAGCKIIAQNLGNRGFVKTIITVGMNEKMKERLIAAKTFKAETERDINTLKKGAEHLRHSLSPAELDKNDMYIKLGIAVQMKDQSLSRVNDDINEIESWIHNTDRVSVNVLGTAYPNSEIHINEVTRLLDSDIFNVTFLQAGDTIITKKFI